MGFKKFLGGANSLTGSRNITYLRDSRHSSYDFGQRAPFKTENAPRNKFNYFIEINFNPLTSSAGVKEFDYLSRFFLPNEQQLLIPLAKSVELPGANIQTEKINQYNHWRISQTKIDYDPITITFHDVVDGKSLRFWEMYYEYYFKDGMDFGTSNTPETARDFPDNVVADTTQYKRKKVGLAGTDNQFTPVVSTHDEYNDTFNKDFGYNLETVQDQKDLIKYISIYLVHAQSYTKVDLINPRVSAFKHDTVSYSDKSDLIELSLTFDYEYFLYDNHSNALPEDKIEDIYGRAHNHELKNFTPNKTSRPFRDRELSGPETNPAPQISQKDTSVLGNLQRNVRGIVDDLPNTLGRAVSSGIMTGEFEFPLDPKSVKDQLVGNVKGQTRAAGARNFGALVKTATGSFTDTARDAIPDPDGSLGGDSNITGTPIP